MVSYDQVARITCRRQSSCQEAPGLVKLWIRSIDHGARAPAAPQQTPRGQAASSPPWQPAWKGTASKFREETVGFSPKCSQKEGLARERDEFFHEETHPSSSSESHHGIPLSLLMVKPYNPSVGVCRGPANPAQPALRSEPPDTPRKDGCCHPILPVPVINASRNAGSLARSGGGVVSRASNSRICSPEPREIQMTGLFVFS